MNETILRFLDSIKKDLGLFMSISFGVFLFILFFQPFPLDYFDFNNRLLFIAGFAFIVFIAMALTRNVFTKIVISNSDQEHEPTVVSNIVYFLMITLCSVAFAFYLRYVGAVSISFFIMLKVFVICLVPAIILGFSDSVERLKLQNDELIAEKKIILKQIEKFEDDYLNKSIDFVSESGGETINLLIAEVVFILSADNYVEIVFTESGSIKKKLLRTTLKSVELQTRQYSNFVRCHRTCIVNLHFIDSLSHSYSNHWLSIKGYAEKLPVSRQYLIKLKEIL